MTTQQPASLLDAEFTGPVHQGRFHVPAAAIPAIREYLRRAYYHDLNRRQRGLLKHTDGHEPDRMLPVPMETYTEDNGRRRRRRIPDGWQYRAPLYMGRGPSELPPATREALQGMAEEAIDHYLGELWAPSPATERGFNAPTRKAPLTHPDGSVTWEPTGDRSPLRPDEWRDAVRMIRGKARRAWWRVARTSGVNYGAGAPLPGGYVGSAALRGDDPARIAAALDRDSVLVPPAHPLHHARRMPLPQDEARAVLCPPDVEVEPAATVPVPGGTGKRTGRRPTDTPSTAGVGCSRSAEYPQGTAIDHTERPRMRYRRAPAVGRLPNRTARWQSASSGGVSVCPTALKGDDDKPIFTYDPAPYREAWRAFEERAAAWNKANGLED